MSAPRTLPPIAIVVDSTSQPSETFIRAHIREIAPGRSFVISRDPTSPAAPCAGALTGIDRIGRVAKLRGHLAAGLRHGPGHAFARDLSPADRARVAEFLRRHGIGHVLVEYLHVAVPYMRLLRSLGVRIFVHAHGYDATVLARSWPKRRMLREVLTLADGVFSPSRHIADRLVALGCPRDRIAVTPCGVSATDFRPADAPRVRILMVGRLVEKKGPLQSLRAFTQVAGCHPAATLDVVGDGPLMEPCRALVAQLGLAGRVAFHGFLDSAQVRRMMAEALMLVQHSVTAANGDQEGLPVAVLEAMSSATPVISTHHSGIPEAVLDGVTGLLVAENDVDGFATAMGRLLDDPGLARRMGDAGREHVLAQFTMNHSVTRIRKRMGLDPLEAAVPTSPTGNEWA